MINVPVAATMTLTFNEIFMEGFPDSEAFIWVSLIVVLVYLDAATNYNMMWCAMTDPGIVPARIWPDYVASKYLVIPGKEEQWDPERRFYEKVLFVNQRISTHLTRLSFCRTCQIW